MNRDFLRRFALAPQAASCTSKKNTMAQHNNLLWLPVPDDAVVQTIHNGTRLGIETVIGWQRMDIPTGYTYLCTNDEMSEEVAKGIVGNTFNERYYKYAPSGVLRPASMQAVYCLDTALDSYRSLERSLGITGRQAVFVKK